MRRLYVLNSGLNLGNAAHWALIAAREDRCPITQHNESVRVKLSVLFVL